MKPLEIAAQEIVDSEVFVRRVAEHCRPVVIRRLTQSWPAVRAAEQSVTSFKQYLAQFAGNANTEIFIGQPQIAGRYYYSEDLKGFNFEREQVRFDAALDRIFATAGTAGERSIYLGSLPTDHYLPGFSRQNSLSILSASAAARLWIGHASHVAAHYDTFDNIACVVAGVRHFTLFAPETLPHLYVGPLDHTMAGQPVSLAAAAPADDERFPLFRQIADQAWTAELQPGDAIYIPKLWWHQVVATSPLNAMVNYWWDAFSAGPDAPSTGLLLSMITIAERPLAERLAWRAFFDHYVFRTGGHPLAHLPPEQHGVLGPLKHNYGKIRARVMQLLRGG